jgi:hypothetical protein
MDERLVTRWSVTLAALHLALAALVITWLPQSPLWTGILLFLASRWWVAAAAALMVAAAAVFPVVWACQEWR